MDGRKFTIIVAVDNQNGIGINGQLPWRLKEDMKYFRLATTSHPRHEKATNAVIMGRKTWESIPEKFRPLKGRTNIVITRNKSYPLPEGVSRSGSLKDAIYVNATKLYVIGGAQIYAEAIKHPNCEALRITRVHKEYECDTFFPSFKEDFEHETTIANLDEGGVSYSIEHWLRR